MSTRDELAELLFDAQHPEGFWMDGNSQPPTASYEDMADALIAEGWRKVPSVSEVKAALAQFEVSTDADDDDVYRAQIAEGILTLMDRGQ